MTTAEWEAPASLIILLTSVRCSSSAKSTKITTESTTNPMQGTDGDTTEYSCKIPSLRNSMVLFPHHNKVAASILQLGFCQPPHPNAWTLIAARLIHILHILPGLLHVCTGLETLNAKDYSKPITSQQACLASTHLYLNHSPSRLLGNNIMTGRQHYRSSLPYPVLQESVTPGHPPSWCCLLCHSSTTL